MKLWRWRTWRPYQHRRRWWAGLATLAATPGLLLFGHKQPPAPPLDPSTSGEMPVIRVDPDKPKLGSIRRHYQNREARRREMKQQRKAAAEQRHEARRPRRTHRHAASGRVGAVLARARELLGVPYVYGGASTSGLDCSGFTMLAYAAAGIRLPHSSALQPRFGRRVYDPRPGDLVKWPWNHVAIYLGGGLTIGAHRSGTVSSISSIYGSPSFYRIID